MFLRYDQGMNTPHETLSPNHPAVEAAARAAAIHGDYDGCFERVDQWNAQEDWEKEAHPDEYPETDIEDCEWWTSRILPALHAAIPHLTSDTEDSLARLRNTPVGRALMAEGWEEGMLDHMGRRRGTMSPEVVSITRERIASANPYRGGDGAAS